VKQSKEAFDEIRDQMVFVPQDKKDNLLDIETHLSWDFAEQVYIPYSSQQVVSITTFLFFLNIILKSFPLFTGEYLF
jgi:hypothetical protein